MGKVFRVAAYRNDAFHHWASYEYEHRRLADLYCEDCRRLCAPITGMTYRVKEIEE